MPTAKAYLVDRVVILNIHGIPLALHEKVARSQMSSSSCSQHDRIAEIPGCSGERDTSKTIRRSPKALIIIVKIVSRQ
ncbi:hypothetical protein DPMN_007188 [Dreissena polymorpha]|uniref:Uncharacterized protein n=1 Tax=Dreissena polymorpha TaxID=45954 RepID=A0A9D4MWW2_DREPO|nr:hypothetical protein DPMN_007188 [Dreissena polymorpha]